MSGVQTTLALQDKLTGPLMKMIKAMDSTIKVMEKMDTAANSVDMKGLEKARKNLQNAAADMERLKSAVPDVGEPFNKLPPQVDRAGGSVRSFFGAFAGAAAAYVSVQSLANGFNRFVRASDQAVSIRARLSLVNDGSQSVEQLQNMIYQSAQRSRGVYQQTADSVSKLGAQARDAFSSTAEIVQFSELLNKTFVNSGASAMGVESVMLQLTQAMAAGVLQGEELNAILDNAQPIVQNIADYMEVPVGSIKKLASEGKITADIIKNSMFSASEDINKKFESMPMTFGQAMNKLKNWSVMAFDPLFSRFNQFINSDAFGVLAGHAMSFISVFTAGMNTLFDLIEWGYIQIDSIGRLMIDGWSLVGPYIILAGSALVAYLTVLTVYRGVLITIAALEAARAFATALSGAALMFATGATFAATAAQYGLNAAIWAFPGTWILAAFIAMIALVISALYFWGDTTAHTVGTIVGSIFWLETAFYNVMIFIANLGIATIEWIANKWNEGVYSIQMGFFTTGQMVGKTMETVGSVTLSVINQVLGGISSVVNKGIGGLNTLISLANKIPNVNISPIGNVDFNAGGSIISSIGGAMQKISPPKEPPSKVNFDRFEYKNLSQAYKSGYDMAHNFTKNVSGSLNNLVDTAKGLIGGNGMPQNPFNLSQGQLDSLVPGNFDAKPFDPSALAGGKDKGIGGKGSNPTGGKLDSIGKIDDEINIADEDLKLLRELAEIRSIQNFVTLQPTTTLTGNNIFREEADVDKLVDKINERMVTTMKESAEGVYG